MKKLSREQKFFAWIGVAVAVAAVSFLVGGALRPAADPYYIFDTEAPAFGRPAQVAATSPGGFTGFGETDGTASHTVIAGRVMELGDRALTLESPGGQRVSLTFGDAPRISRLEDGARDMLRPGVTIAVRLQDDGETVSAVLVLSQP